MNAAPTASNVVSVATSSAASKASSRGSSPIPGHPPLLPKIQKPAPKEKARLVAAEPPLEIPVPPITLCEALTRSRTNWTTHLFPPAPAIPHDAPVMLLGAPTLVIGPHMFPGTEFFKVMFPPPPEIESIWNAHQQQMQQMSKSNDPLPQTGAGLEVMKGVGATDPGNVRENAIQKSQSTSQSSAPTVAAVENTAASGTSGGSHLAQQQLPTAPSTDQAMGTVTETVYSEPTVVLLPDGTLAEIAQPVPSTEGLVGNSNVLQPGPVTQEANRHQRGEVTTTLPGMVATAEQSNFAQHTNVSHAPSFASQGPFQPAPAPETEGAAKAITPTQASTAESERDREAIRKRMAKPRVPKRRIEIVFRFRDTPDLSWSLPKNTLMDTRIGASGLLELLLALYLPAHVSKGSRRLAPHQGVLMNLVGAPKLLIEALNEYFTLPSSVTKSMAIKMEKYPFISDMRIDYTPNPVRLAPKRPHEDDDDNPDEAGTSLPDKATTAATSTATKSTGAETPAPSKKRSRPRPSRRRTSSMFQEAYSANSQAVAFTNEVNESGISAVVAEDARPDSSAYHNRKDVGEPSHSTAPPLSKASKRSHSPTQTGRSTTSRSTRQQSVTSPSVSAAPIDEGFSDGGTGTALAVVASAPPPGKRSHKGYAWIIEPVDKPAANDFTASVKRQAEELLKDGIESSPAESAKRRRAAAAAAAAAVSTSAALSTSSSSGSFSAPSVAAPKISHVAGDVAMADGNPATAPSPQQAAAGLPGSAAPMFSKVKIRVGGKTFTGVPTVAAAPALPPNPTNAPAVPTPKPARPPPSASSATAQRRVCTSCGVKETPLWRMGPAGPKSLCNACGVRYSKGRLKDKNGNFFPRPK
ncbi:hypothetical protein DFJ73DRAFT_816394 [Zopfochytrium polystomum]|nr:hypothetical protein DFJ73DRAFT_816394 [Zopfochytrium polystomum]